MSIMTQNSRRVLFVDDDAQFLETIKGLMTAFSGGTWDVSTADSASNAFNVLQQQPVDLIVLDLQMGVMDGVQMLSLLNRGYPNVQKAVLTGLVNEKYRAACLGNGADLFLEKPVNEKGWGNLFTVLDELARFKPEEGFRGVLRRVGLPDVLQMECLARSSSVLEISNGQITGQIFLEDGQIIHAQVGDDSGEAAFNRLMALSGGHFNLKPFTEPPTRTISGPWEFLLMEAARKRDEAADVQPANLEEKDGETSVPASRESKQPATETPTPPGATPTTAPVPSSGPRMVRPRIEEFLICSTQGDVLHEWQCRNPHVWVNFFEFLSQRAQRIEQVLPLGDFERLEIQNGDTRAVVIISVDKGVLVRTRQVPQAG